MFIQDFVCIPGAMFNLEEVSHSVNDGKLHPFTCSEYSNLSSHCTEEMILPPKKFEGL